MLAQSWGLRQVFEPWNLPKDPETGRFNGGLEGLKKHYVGLSSRYGFAVTPDEIQVNALGYQALGNDNTDGAIEIFAYNVNLYPDSTNVYDSYAEALEAAGRSGEALANYRKAVATAERIGDERLGVFKENLDRFPQR